MTEISLTLPDDLSSVLIDLVKTNSQNVNCLVVGVPRDYVEYERGLTAQIELAVEAADQGHFASNDQVVAMRPRRWSRNAS